MSISSIGTVNRQATPITAGSATTNPDVPNWGPNVARAPETVLQNVPTAAPVSRSAPVAPTTPTKIDGPTVYFGTTTIPANVQNFTTPPDVPRISVLASVPVTGKRDFVVGKFYPNESADTLRKTHPHLDWDGINEGGVWGVVAHLPTNPPKGAFYVISAEQARALRPNVGWDGKEIGGVWGALSDGPIQVIRSPDVPAAVQAPPKIPAPMIHPMQVPAGTNPNVPLAVQGGGTLTTGTQVSGTVGTKLDPKPTPAPVPTSAASAAVQAGASKLDAETAKAYVPGTFYPGLDAGKMRLTHPQFGWNGHAINGVWGATPSIPDAKPVDPKEASKGELSPSSETMQQNSTPPPDGIGGVPSWIWLALLFLIYFLFKDWKFFSKAAK